MRIDVFLSAVNILKSRSLAKEAVDRGKVTVNGRPVKAAHAVSEGDHIRLDLGARILEVAVVGIPPGPVARKQSRDFYDVLVDERPEIEL